MGLARTLLSDPAIMFLDEPTSGLDPVAAREVHDLIIGLRQQGSDDLPHHPPARRGREALRPGRHPEHHAAHRWPARRICGNSSSRSALVVTTLEPLVDPDQLFASHHRRRELERRRRPASYVLSVSDPRLAAPEVTRGLVGAGADVLSIGEAQHSLEDVYLELIDEDVEARKP